MYINNFLAPVQLGQGVTTLDIDLPDGTYRLTLADSATAAARWEIVDAVVEDGTATLTRGLEGTDDQAWPLGSVMYCALTAGVLNDLLTRLAAAESAIHSIPADIAARLLPAGGAEGQSLIKASGADFDVAWGQPVPGLTQWALLLYEDMLAFSGSGPAVTAWSPESGSIQRMSASPDGTRLAIGMLDGTTLVLDATGVTVLDLPAAGFSAAAPAWHGSGDFLAVERADTKAIQIYDLAAGVVVGTVTLPTFEGAARSVSALAFADNYLLASAWAGGDATMYVYDTSGELLLTRAASGGGVFTQFDAEHMGTIFAVSETGLMRLFDGFAGFTPSSPPFFSGQMGIKYLATSPDDSYMAIAVAQGAAASTLYIWDYYESAFVDMPAQSAELLAGSLAWSRDGARLYVTPNGGEPFYVDAQDWGVTLMGGNATKVQTLQLESAPWS